MKASALKYLVLSIAAFLVTIIIILLPFHAFLTVWVSNLVGNYTALRLWKEALLLVLVLCAVYFVMTDHKIRSNTLTRRLIWLVLAYAGLHIIVGLIALQADRVTPKALLYGLLINLRFLAFFLIAWAVAIRLSRLQKKWRQLLLIPASVVIGFGLLQMTVLPVDFLNNFGYGPNTIDAYGTVNSNQDYIRIASTLRGPNPLGAYLMIPIVGFAVLLIYAKRKWPYGLAIVAGVLVMAGSYSRSAALGLVAALLALLFTTTNLKQIMQFIENHRKHVATGAVFGLIGFVAVIALAGEARIKNIVFHTDDQSTIATSSNDGRQESLVAGVKDIANHPLGEGPGSAGPASVYNDNRVEIAENYFLQIGQEVGIVGMLLFIFICSGVGYLLWLRRADPLAAILFCSLLGITFVNLLSHAWADDTLAYVWWGLAGIAIANLPMAKADVE